MKSIKKFTQSFLHRQNAPDLFFPTIRFLEHGTSLKNLEKIFHHGGELRPRCLTKTNGSGVTCNDKVVYFSLTPASDSFDMYYTPLSGHCKLFLNPSLLVDFFPKIYINPNWLNYGQKTQRSFSINQLQKQMNRSKDISMIEIMIQSSIPLDRYLCFILVNAKDKDKWNELIEKYPEYGKYFRQK